MWYNQNAVSLCCHVTRTWNIHLFIYLLLWRGLLSYGKKTQNILFIYLFMYVFFYSCAGQRLITINHIPK